MKNKDFNERLFKVIELILNFSLLLRIIKIKSTEEERYSAFFNK